MLQTFLPLAVNPLPFPPFVFGLIAVCLAFIGLIGVLSLGASRPHS